jgi:hypothetical protein
MAVAKDFPCKVCRHLAERHYVNISTGTGVCTGCQIDEPGYTDDRFHDFDGDNLAFMELKKKKQELLNEQA